MFGGALFFLKSTPNDIMEDIFRAAVPFGALQILGLILVIIFPQIALGFPTRKLTDEE
jgi:TRAP-type mannitol/chloroaromatic compound transport system permease large subunit